MVVFEEMMEQLKSKLLSGTLLYKDTVVIGDNGVGKTNLLQKLNCNKEDCIYIDMVRNDFDIGNDYKFKLALIDNLGLAKHNEFTDVYEVLEQLPKADRIVVVTHSLRFLAQLNNFNIIKLQKNGYLIADSNDFNTIEDCRELIKELDMNDINMYTLVNLKLSDKWTELEEEKLLKLNGNKSLYFGFSK